MSNDFIERNKEKFELIKRDHPFLVENHGHTTRRSQITSQWEKTLPKDLGGQFNLENATISRVIDGDTFVVKNTWNKENQSPGEEEVTVRVAGVDAPEGQGRQYLEARLAEAARIDLTKGHTGEHGRRVFDVVLTDHQGKKQHLGDRLVSDKKAVESEGPNISSGVTDSSWWSHQIRSAAYTWGHEGFTGLVSRKTREFAAEAFTENKFLTKDQIKEQYGIEKFPGGATEFEVKDYIQATEWDRQLREDGKFINMSWAAGVTVTIAGMIPPLFVGAGVGGAAARAAGVTRGSRIIGAEEAAAVIGVDIPQVYADKIQSDYLGKEFNVWAALGLAAAAGAGSFAVRNWMRHRKAVKKERAEQEALLEEKRIEEDKIYQRELEETQQLDAYKKAKDDGEIPREVEDFVSSLDEAEQIKMRKYLATVHSTNNKELMDEAFNMVKKIKESSENQVEKELAQKLDDSKIDDTWDETVPVSDEDILARPKDLPDAEDITFGTSQERKKTATLKGFKPNEKVSETAAHSKNRQAILDTFYNKSKAGKYTKIQDVRLSPEVKNLKGFLGFLEGLDIPYNLKPNKGRGFYDVQIPKDMRKRLSEILEVDEKSLGQFRFERKVKGKKLHESDISRLITNRTDVKEIEIALKQIEGERIALNKQRGEDVIRQRQEAEKAFKEEVRKKRAALPKSKEREIYTSGNGKYYTNKDIAASKASFAKDEVEITPLKIKDEDFYYLKETPMTDQEYDLAMSVLKRAKKINIDKKMSMKGVWDIVRQSPYYREKFLRSLYDLRVKNKVQKPYRGVVYDKSLSSGRSYKEIEIAEIDAIRRKELLDKLNDLPYYKIGKGDRRKIREHQRDLEKLREKATKTTDEAKAKDYEQQIENLEESIAVRMKIGVDARFEPNTYALKQNAQGEYFLKKRSPNEPGLGFSKDAFSLKRDEAIIAKRDVERLGKKEFGDKILASVKPYREAVEAAIRDSKVTRSKEELEKLTKPAEPEDIKPKNIINENKEADIRKLLDETDEDLSLEDTLKESEQLSKARRLLDKKRQEAKLGLVSEDQVARLEARVEKIAALDEAARVTKACRGD